MATKGFAVDTGPADHESLRDWEAVALDAVGTVIEFWGFKRNHGRLWGLLYLRGVPLTASQLQSVLDLSKGAVSMLTRELEQWHVVRRVRQPGEAGWRFAAVTDFATMVTNVFERREGDLIARVAADLNRSASLALDDWDADEAAVDRVHRMGRLATMVSAGLQSMLTLAFAQFQGVKEVLSTPTTPSGGDDG